MFLAFLAAAAAALPRATPIDVASWFSADDYPAEAQKKGVEGNTTFEVDVNMEGNPTACRIRKSSGSALLDQTTCDIVLKKAKFKPAMRRGEAVPGRYSNMASWRLDGLADSTRYVATILDFSKDPLHPTWSIVSKDFPAPPTCEQALQKLGPVGAIEKVSKLVSLTSITTGDAQGYRGEADWGRRLAFIAFNLYPPKEGAKPFCEIVAEEGAPPDSNPCERYADAATLSDEAKRDARKAHFEQSLFGVMQDQRSTGKCKDGESAAEVHSCAG